MIQQYAIMQFSIASCILLYFSRIDYGMQKVLLQNTFQPSMPLLNAFFGLTKKMRKNNSVKSYYTYTLFELRGKTAVFWFIGNKYYCQNCDLNSAKVCFRSSSSLLSRIVSSSSLLILSSIEITGTAFSLITSPEKR